MTKSLFQKRWVSGHGSLLLILVFFIAACGRTEPPQETPPPPPAQTSTPAATGETETPTEAGEPATATPTPAEASASPTTDATATMGTDTPTPAAVPEGPLHTPTLEFGVVDHLYYTDHERTLQLTRNAGFDWVRQQVVWRDMEMIEPEAKYVWDQLDPIVNAVDAYDLKLLISVVQAPAFYNPDGGLPQEPAALGRFVQAMAERYGDKVDAYEIWNEQNLAHETGGRITPDDAGHYVDILIECYTRIKAVNPNAYVLAGAPSSTGVTQEDVALSDLDYYKAMYTYKNGIVRDYFDAQAVHPGGSANPPETLWPDNPSTAQGWTDHSTFYFRHIENVRNVMEEYGMGDHQMWITEYGWATENVTLGYEFGNQVSFEQQAEYITGAVSYVYKNYPWVGNMFLWNMNFAVTWKEHLEALKQKQDRTPEETKLIELYWNDANPAQPLHEQAAFAILDGDWIPRPSYLALQKLMAQIKQEQGR